MRTGGLPRADSAGCGPRGRSKAVPQRHPLWQHLHLGQQRLSYREAGYAADNRAHGRPRRVRSRRAGERHGVGGLIAGAHVLSARMQEGEPPSACQPHLLSHERGGGTGWLSPVNVQQVLTGPLVVEGRHIGGAERFGRVTPKPEFLMRPRAAALFLGTLLTVAPLCLTAQGYRFAEIPWGSNGETLKKMMAVQSLMLVKVDSDGDYEFKGTLAQYLAVVWGFMAGGKLVKVAVYLITPDNKAREEYRKMKDVLITKYGPPTSRYDYFQGPYEEGDGYEDQAIRLGKGHFFTVWTTVTESDTSNLGLQISERLAVIISYESPRWNGEADRRKAKATKAF